ncbi:acyl-CoA dehydrogenase [Humibacillus xanthopallidus]|uniref:acyl-CoA dehydrogenase n=1 Tax=Humibacillus xanthopallidus TaxID=412689 RepID=UPI003850E511
MTVTDRVSADLAADAARARGDVIAALDLPGSHAAAFPLPGSGATWRLWTSLAVLGSVDLTVARAVEPHLDALAILAEARAAGHGGEGADDDGARWGVFAAEGPGSRLVADESTDPTTLGGRKPWCSLAGSLDRALVTAWCGDDTRRLYAVRLGAANGVALEEGAWVARGLPLVPSGPVSFTASVAHPVGPPGWYLERSGFAWGGMGVAAIWWGGAVGVARRLREQLGRREPDQVGLMHLGAVDATLHAASTVLEHAATSVDTGDADGPAGAALALRVRRVVALSVEEVLGRVGHALGPGPLALEEEHAGRVADLQLYVRQEHAERDAAVLGRQVLSHSAEGPDAEVLW